MDSTGFKFKIMKPIDGPQEFEMEVFLYFMGDHETTDHIRGQKIFIVVSDGRIP